MFLFLNTLHLRLAYVFFNLTRFLMSPAFSRIYFLRNFFQLKALVWEMNEIFKFVEFYVFISYVEFYIYTVLGRVA